MCMTKHILPDGQTRICHMTSSHMVLRSPPGACVQQDLLKIKSVTSYNKEGSQEGSTVYTTQQKTQYIFVHVDL